MKEILESIEFLISSNSTALILALFWVFIQMRTNSEDKKRHFEERQSWAERFDKSTEAINHLIQVIHEIDRERDKQQIASYIAHKNME